MLLQEHGLNQQTIKKSVNINAVGEYINLGTQFNNLMNGNNAFTVSMWVKPSDVTQQGVFFSDVNNSPNEYEGSVLYIRGDATSPNTIRFYLIDDFRIGGYLRKAFTHSMTNNNWYLITLTYNGSGNTSGVNVYQNNVLLPEITSDANNPNFFFNGLEDTRNLHIGNSNGQLLGPAVYGQYKGITIWNIALNATQVNNLYNAGKSTNPRIAVNNTNLLMWLRVDEDNIFHPTCRDSQQNYTATYVNINKSDITTDVP